MDIPYIIGSDIGTSSTKSVALSMQGKVMGSTQLHYPTLSPERGYSEQEPHQVVAGFMESIKQLVKKLGYPPTALCLSSAMHSVMLMDSTGRPITPLVLWSDSRSSAIAERIRDSAEGKNIYEATGTPVHAMSPLCKIIWYRENRPELFRQTYKFISIKEYIWYCLFGAYEIDHSIASATGLFHLEQLSWNMESLRLAGISKEKLSDPVRTLHHRTGCAPAIATDLGILPSTPVYIGASDGCLANLGTGSLDPGTAAITIGTSGAVRVARKSPLRNYASMSFNYILDEKTFICGGPVNNGGSVVQWLLQGFLGISSPKKEAYALLFEKIQTVPAGSNGLLFLPYINGERAPLWDEHSSGLFFGIRPFHNQECFLRSALEGVCYALRHILISLEESGRPIRQIHASGGGVHSSVWMHLLADITGKPVHIQQTEDASAIGAAYLVLQDLDSRFSLPAVHQKGWIRPDQKNLLVYEKGFELFKDLYPLLKDSMRQLDDIRRT